MKVLLFLVLVGLAAVEYFHHRSHDHQHDAPASTGQQAKMDNARELLRQHLRSH